MIALDTEATGVDFYHGSRPYFVTIAKDSKEQIFYEWSIDPLTRQPNIPAADIYEIRDYLAMLGRWSTFDSGTVERHKIVLQNSKYDVTALASIGIDNFPWHQCHDTLVAAHILASNQPHDLTSLALIYLSIDIQPYEDALHDACISARRLAKKEFPDWQLAQAGLPSMPSAKSVSKEKVQRGGESERLWKADAWLPRALVERWWLESASYNQYQRLYGPRATIAMVEPCACDGWEYHPPELDDLNPDKNDDPFNLYKPVHSWWTVLRDYSNTDSAVTLLLWPVLVKELKRRGLWKIYQWKNRLMHLAYRLERNGVTYNLATLQQLEQELSAQSQACRRRCAKIAQDKGYALDLPKKGLNNSLRQFCFSTAANCLGLPTVKVTPKGVPSLDKYAVADYKLTLEPGSAALEFLTSLIDGRKMDTGLGFLESYRKFGIPCTADGESGFVRLHPQFNPCGTDSTRFSSSNPNAQQLSRQEKINLRKCFGPLPGREWYSADAKNIELRIPAYYAGEPDMIALFEKANEPPFYGSSHLLNFSIIYPDIWAKELQEVGLEKVGPHIKSKYDGSWYTYAKNTGLGIQYRAGRTTADKAAHREGSYDKIVNRFARLHGPGGLNEHLLTFARKHGYVESIPSKSIDPRHGYPLMVARNEHGKVLDTTPLNYVVQSTAGDWMGQALLRCQEQLDEWYEEDSFNGFITLTVHDELVFDLPKVENNGNLWRVQRLRELMEQGGVDINVPTPVSVERHTESWADGEEIDV